MFPPVTFNAFRIAVSLTLSSGTTPVSDSTKGIDEADAGGDAYWFFSVEQDKATVRFKFQHELKIFFSHVPVYGVGELDGEREILWSHFLRMKHRIKLSRAGN